MVLLYKKGSPPATKHVHLGITRVLKAFPLHYDQATNLFNCFYFHPAQCNSETIIVLNHYNIVNGTQGNHTVPVQRKLDNEYMLENPFHSTKGFCAPMQRLNNFHIWPIFLGSLNMAR